MYKVLACIQNNHSAIYLATAIAICVLGLATAHIVYNRALVATSRRSAGQWAMTAMMSVGLGAWATHYTAMLGYRPGFEVVYDGWITLGSAFISTIGFAVAGHVIIGGTTPVRRALTAIICTASVCIMHYVGMEALRSAAIIEYDPALVTASVLVCWGCFMGAWFIGLDRSSQVKSNSGFALILLGVTSLHFVGMGAVNIVPINMPVQLAWELKPSGLSHWIVVAASLILGVAVLAAGLDRLISRLRSASNRRLRLVGEATSDGIVIVRDGRIAQVNDTALELLGVSAKKLVGKKGRALEKLLGHALPDRAMPDRVRVTILHKSGDVPVEITCRYLEDGDGEFQVVSLYDMRVQDAHERELNRLAYTDALTGLPNRAAFTRLLKTAIGNASTDHPVAVFLADLDKFKQINDVFGHLAGDAAIRFVAKQLTDAIGPEDVVARLGGDEFAILVTGRRDVDEIETMAAVCVGSLNRVAELEGRRVQLHGSVGGSLVEASSEKVSDVLRAADRALYEAKVDETCRYHFYSDSLHQKHETRRNLEEALQHAVHNNEFVLHYQPKVSSATRELMGFEALVRWERPGHGMVYPGAFIEIAEESELIHRIGRWVLQEAVQTLTTLPAPLTISVNLSARQFLDPTLLSTFQRVLKDYDFDPSRLEIEVTETALVENGEAAGRVLETLKKLGFKLSLDDFGTGYSSMTYLQKFPFDKIKIDRSFVTDMNANPTSEAIVNAVIGLGHGLRMPIVAEGVETEDQATSLKRSNCQELQGYLIGRPAPLETFSQQIVDFTTASAQKVVQFRHV